MQTVFTTGDVAKICSVTVVTVNKWFDSGKLTGYKMPGSRSRRIPRDELIEFMQKYGLPIEKLNMGGAGTVLVVDTDKKARKVIREVVGKYFDDLAVEDCEDVLSACIAIGAKAPSLVIIDATMQETDCARLIKKIKTVPSMSSAKILALAGRTNKKSLADAADAGADEGIEKPLNEDKLVRAISKLLRIPVTTA